MCHTAKQLEDLVMTEMAKPSVYGGEREGVVIRVSDIIYGELFDTCVAKCVRENHVQTDEHWTNKPIERQIRWRGDRPGAGRSWDDPPK